MNIIKGSVQTEQPLLEINTASLLIVWSLSLLPTVYTESGRAWSQVHW